MCIRDSPTPHKPHTPHTPHTTTCWAAQNPRTRLPCRRRSPGLTSHSAAADDWRSAARQRVVSRVAGRPGSRGARVRGRQRAATGACVRAC
eukprot:287740-Chlamydomonas_euryale.AAC.1